MNSTAQEAAATAGASNNRFAAGCAWIEGDYVPIGDARIPILDAGFVRSDLTYDVVGVWEGRFFRLADHLARLERGCARIRLPIPVSTAAIQEILAETVRRSGLREAYVETVITRGVPAPGERDPRKWTPRLYAYAIPYMWIVRPEQQEVGTQVIVARDTRRIPPGSVDPTVKNFHWADLTKGLFEAFDAGARHPVLVDRHGNVTEGPGFNIFIVKDGEVVTPASGVLLGITRKTVIELARQAGIAVREQTVSAREVREADEVFLSSTAGGVLPVTILEGNPVGDGKPGKVTTIIRHAYWDAHEDPRYVTPVRY